MMISICCIYSPFYNYRHSNSGLYPTIYFSTHFPNKIYVQTNTTVQQSLKSHSYNHQQVFSQKHADDYTNDFLMNVVLLCWFVHIFCLENVSKSKWYDKNRNWNVCNCRKGYIYNKLKSSFHLDSIRMLEDEYVGYY